MRVFREGQRARVTCRLPQARACPAHVQASTVWSCLPGDALVELVGRGGLEQRISGGIVLGVGGLPHWRAADAEDDPSPNGQPGPAYELDQSIAW